MEKYRETFVILTLLLAVANTLFVIIPYFKCKNYDGKNRLVYIFLSTLAYLIIFYPLTSYLNIYSVIFQICILFVGGLFYIPIHYRKNDELIENHKIVKQIINDTTSTYEERESDKATKKYKKSLYKIFLNVMVSYSSNDIANIKNITTRPMYDRLLKEQKNNNKDIIVMTDFNLRSFTIRNQKEINNELLVDALIDVSYIRYVTNEDGELIDGDKDCKVNSTFFVVYVGTNEDGKFQCFSCGAPIKDESDLTCPYCNQELIYPQTKFLIDTIEER